MSGNSPLDGRMTEHPMTEATPLASEQITQLPTAEQIAHAIKATEYKYFGDYEMSDDQRKAVDVLVQVAQHYALSASPAPSGQGVSGERLGPLWRDVQVIHADAMAEGWSIGEYRAAMAYVLGLAAPAPSCAPGEVEAVAIIREMVRLANMGFEESMREPEENGNYAVYERAKRFLAALSPQRLDAATVEREGDLAYERQYFERGFIAAYAWAATKRADVQLSDDVIDHAWAHRDEGMDADDMLPVRALATEPHQHGGKGA